MDTPEIPKQLSWRIERKVDRATGTIEMTTCNEVGQTLAKYILNTQDKLIREALVGLGWMPPESRQRLYEARNLIEDYDARADDVYGTLNAIDGAIRKALYGPGAPAVPSPSSALNPTAGS